VENFNVITTPVNTIVTYHIYHNDQIEKHIPSLISEEHKNKYKYVYHDKDGAEHEICICNIFNTRKKRKGIKHKEKPSHRKIVQSYKNLKDGDTTDRVIYENGDVAEYGSLYPQWRLYKAENEIVELVKMPDYINYNKKNVVINLVFYKTERKYINPDLFAGFLGAIAEVGFQIYSTGSSFITGSSFPSISHVNGLSIDVRYFSIINNNFSSTELVKDQKVINAMKKFFFDYRLIGNNNYCKQLLNGTNRASDHNDHLHVGLFNFQKIKVIRK